MSFTARRAWQRSSTSCRAAEHVDSVAPSEGGSWSDFNFEPIRFTTHPGARLTNARVRSLAEPNEPIMPCRVIYFNELEGHTWLLIVYAKALALARDYKNVHQDVAVLEATGLLIRDSRKLSAPWDELQANVSLLPPLSPLPTS